MSNKIGAIAEQIFIAESLKKDIFPSTPIVDCQGYDFLIEIGDSFAKVQVKSVAKKDPSRNSYKCNVKRGFDGRSYDKGDYDFLAVYIFSMDIFYIIPFDSVSATTIRMNPDSNKCKYKKFLNAWHLLK